MNTSYFVVDVVSGSFTDVYTPKVSIQPCDNFGERLQESQEVLFKSSRKPEVLVQVPVQYPILILSKVCKNENGRRILFTAALRQFNGNPSCNLCKRFVFAPGKLPALHKLQYSTKFNCPSGRIDRSSDVKLHCSMI